MVGDYDLVLQSDFPLKHTLLRLLNILPIATIVFSKKSRTRLLNTFGDVGPFYVYNDFIFFNGKAMYTQRDTLWDPNCVMLKDPGSDYNVTVLDEKCDFCGLISSAGRNLRAPNGIQEGTCVS